MQKGDFIFVYGTLRKGQRADLRQHARSFDVLYIRDDLINGTIYHLGSYPGAKLPESREFDAALPTIKGEVFRIQHPSVAALLDAYEGYDHDDPSKGLFDRRKTETQTGIEAWVYTYNFPIRAEQEIPGGDWPTAQLILPRTQIFR